MPVIPTDPVSPLEQGLRNQQAQREHARATAAQLAQERAQALAGAATPPPVAETAGGSEEAV